MSTFLTYKPELNLSKALGFEEIYQSCQHKLLCKDANQLYLVD
ncbi:hypothetical protein Lepto7375DRAFT_7473 [Leptolyngbya sp. PCC 7375]|nr:hypothetical protein Lepto7375DRAFT_7473 [Leptolyngbya sp. PCC 7375]